MKKVYLFGAIAGLMMASCANDDLVVKPAPAVDGATPISFRMNVGNMSRADQALNAAGYTNFGVWAIKANEAGDVLGVNLTASPLSKLVVMPNYRVSYDATNGWTYDKDADYTQYLKYWDGSYTNTYFFAYGRHSASNVSLTFDAANKTATLKFPKINSENVGEGFIYADVTIENNRSHVTNASTVALKFHYIFSRLIIGVYEDIPGYKVKMVNVVFNDAVAADPEHGIEAKPATTGGIVAIPAKYEDDTWSRGSITTAIGAEPEVVYSEEDDVAFAKATLNINESGCESSEENINFDVPAGDAEHFISSSYTDGPSMSETSISLIPAEGNDGLQFVMNFDLYSEDTNEVIHVRGARVYVQPEFTAWQKDTQYKYIFRITTNTTGTTIDTKPINNPTDIGKALYPIVFENVTITNLEDGEVIKEWDVNSTNDDEINPHTPDDDEIHPKS